MKIVNSLDFCIHFYECHNQYSIGEKLGRKETFYGVACDPNIGTFHIFPQQKITRSVICVVRGLG